MCQKPVIMLLFVILKKNPGPGPYQVSSLPLGYSPASLLPIFILNRVSLSISDCPSAFYVAQESFELPFSWLNLPRSRDDRSGSPRPTTVVFWYLQATGLHQLVWWLNTTCYLEGFHDVFSVNDPVTLQHLPFPLTVKGRLNKTGTLIILKCCPAGQNEHLGCLSQRGLLQQTASDWIASKQHQAQETACLVTCGLARGGASVRPPKNQV